LFEPNNTMKYYNLKHVIQNLNFRGFMVNLDSSQIECNQDIIVIEMVTKTFDEK
jgi:hypothetical protein